ncbi:hypothetical protein [Limnobacter sp.]|uniref:hypothetical protein n=1 Tax=Limnobacter sp. TaxID=2003368 RepID=UPI003747C5D8
MGYTFAKKEILSALKSGNYQHESRGDIDVKNLLAMGKVTADQVAALVASSNGSMHSESPHHVLKSVSVHVITVKDWYIKFYFLEPDAWFISVHK